MQQPEDDRIRATAQSLFAAMGVADREIEYAYDIRRSVSNCAERLGVDPEQAYYARRAYAVRAGAPLDRERVYRAALTQLAGDGWEVQEYEPRFGGAPAFLARKGDSYVNFDGGGPQFAVTTGPCSPLLGGYPSPQWTPVPEASFKPLDENLPKPPIRTPRATPSG